MVCIIGWFTLYFIQKKHYFEGYPTQESEFYGSLKGLFVIISFVATLINFYYNKNDKT